MKWIEPDWPAPTNVRCASTLREGGVSTGSFASLNLATHVGDDPLAVRINRSNARSALKLPVEPLWLEQVHGVAVATGLSPDGRPPIADASVAVDSSQVCVILTADCLPVAFCDRAGSCVAAAHAGWRGLAGGVLGAVVKSLPASPAQLMAWLGPAIEPDAFEVGSEVREQFVSRDGADAEAFQVNARGRWQADLYQLARRDLHRAGVTRIYGGGFRCFADSERFFSYRREARTGRMATMVWLTR